MIAPSSGVTKAEVEALLPKPVVEHAFAVPGPLTSAQILPGLTIRLESGEEKALIGADLFLEEGTSAIVTLLKNGSSVGASYKEVEVKKGTPARITSEVALSDKDRLTLEVKTATGEPKVFSYTFDVRQIK